MIKLVSLAVIISFALVVTADARNNRVGQNSWCWVSQNGVEFCDYSSFQSCRDANRRSGDGTCIRR